MDISDCFYIGTLSKTRGLKGELQLFFEFDDYLELDLDVLFLEIEGKLVPFFVDALKMQQNRTAYLFLEDIDHIDQAKALVHKKAYLPNNKRPARDPSDFRYTDLAGFEVTDTVRGVLGKIHEIHQYPQQFVAAVWVQEHEILFPLNDDMIENIDLENQRLTVTLPEGLIDLYLL